MTQTKILPYADLINGAHLSCERTAEFWVYALLCLSVWMCANGCFSFNLIQFLVQCWPEQTDNKCWRNLKSYFGLCCWSKFHEPLFPAAPLWNSKCKKSEMSLVCCSTFPTRPIKRNMEKKVKDGWRGEKWKSCCPQKTRIIMFLFPDGEWGWMEEGRRSAGPAVITEQHQSLVIRPVVPLLTLLVV